jgi:large-conductance mechanosensitive channel
MFDIAVIIAVIVALTQLVKEFVPNRFIPLLTVILGVVSAYVYVDGDIKVKIMYGLMIGLSAAGLFDQTKIVTKKGDSK